MPLLEIQGGHLSDRVHPGSVARWQGSPVECHSRYLLYLDTLEYEKQFDLLYNNAVLLSQQVTDALDSWDKACREFIAAQAS